ncbi:MAG: universal stress protein [Nocardioides sp.]|nr:universal stress protein [Nocardioides sp.]
MDETEIGVLVAVGPGGIGAGALEVAASEAIRLGVGVELLHVAHQLVVPVPTQLRPEQAVDRELTRVGREALTVAADRVRGLVEGRVPVTTEIVDGSAPRTIVERSGEMRLVVLEAREIGAVGRLVTRSVSTHVAAHARVPVLVVPRGWSASVGGDLPVTVGVDEPIDAKHQVLEALELARDTGRQVVVLHATWIAEPYQGAAFAGYPRKQWLDDARAELETALGDVTTTADSVTCDVHWARPVEALVRATQRSSVLVLNRRSAERPLGPHLGPITRAVLHHAECPVLIVDRGY